MVRNTLRQQNKKTYCNIYGERNAALMVWSVNYEVEETEKYLWWKLIILETVQDVENDRIRNHELRRRNRKNGKESTETAWTWGACGRYMTEEYVSGLHYVTGEEGNKESCEQKAF